MYRYIYPYICSPIHLSIDIRSLGQHFFFTTDLLGPVAVCSDCSHTAVTDRLFQWPVAVSVDCGTRFVVHVFCVFLFIKMFLFIYTFYVYFFSSKYFLLFIHFVFFFIKMFLFTYTFCVFFFIEIFLLRCCWEDFFLQL